MLLKPDIPMILKEENMDEDTCKRFSRAKKPSKFSITKMDYKNTVSEEADDEPTFNTLPNKHKNKTTKELLQNISTGLTNILTSASKKKGNNKKLKVGEVSELENITESVSSLVAFINKTRSTKFDSLQDMHDYYQEKVQLTTKIIRDALWLWKNPMIARTLVIQTTLVAVNQPETKKPRLKNANQLRRIRLDSWNE
jgi:hypothetical protein